MNELMEFIIPKDFENFSLPSPDEITYWRLRKQRCFCLDYEIEDDYRCVDLIKNIIQLNLEEADIPESELKPVFLYIFSYGGDTSQAMGLCDVIEASRIPIITVCMGVAMSASFLIFLAGKRRYAFKQSLFLAHQGFAQFEGTAQEIEEAQKNYKKTLDKMKYYIIDHTDIDEKLFNKNKTKDWYISAKEAEDLKIATIVNSFADIK